MRTEIDWSIQPFKEGWHHALSLHVPCTDNPHYLAGWNEGLRLRTHDVELRIAQIKQGTDRRVLIPRK